MQVVQIQLFSIKYKYLQNIYSTGNLKQSNCRFSSDCPSEWNIRDVT